jgi:hypothetical protein
VARLADIDEEQADIEEANRLISEIPKEEEEPVLEEMASDLVELSQPVGEPVEYYPFPMTRPLEGDAKAEQDLINSIPVLENEETWAQAAIDQDEPEDTDAKRQWKMLNPHDTIKRQRSLYERGFIDALPWDVIEKFDEEKESAEVERLEVAADPLTPDYEADDGPLTDEQIAALKADVEEFKKKELHNETAESADQEEKVTYVQNSEQSSDSIWKKIQERKS